MTQTFSYNTRVFSAPSLPQEFVSVPQWRLSPEQSGLHTRQLVNINLLDLTVPKLPPHTRSEAQTLRRLCCT